MERSLHNVVSLDKDRVMLSSLEDGLQIIIKKTRETEYRNILQMTEHLLTADNSLLLVNGSPYKIITPEITTWNGITEELTTKYFDGQNLEILLHDMSKDKRDINIDFLKTFVFWMKQKGIIWKDAAPRNILINEETKTICIVDFEKGNKLQNSPYSQEDFDSNIRGIIFEEMAAFLFPHEQALIFGNIWTNIDRIISVDSLRGKREPILYEKMFGKFETEISQAKLLLVQKFMADMVTPYLIDGEPFFPLTLLAEAGSPQRYTTLLLELNHIDRREWPLYLINALKR